MDEIADALYARWNAASLDSSVAELYPGGEGSRTENETGSPPATSLPRAEYHIMNTPPQVKTRGSRVMQAIVTITVWAAVPEDRDAYLASIWDAFVNSDAAATSPFSMSTGTALEVDDGGQLALKADDNIFMGRQVLHVRHRVLNATPA